MSKTVLLLKHFCGNNHSLNRKGVDNFFEYIFVYIYFILNFFYNLNEFTITFDN